MNLQSQLDATTNFFADQLSVEQNKVFDDVIEAALQNHIEENAPKIGQFLADFELPAADGSTFRLSEKLKEGPLIISFYRGSWCPYCNLELKAYQDILPEIKQRSGNLVAISPEFPERAQETITKEGIGFDVLTDQDNQLSEKLGLLFHHSVEVVDLIKNLGFDLEFWHGKGNTLVIPIPATLVVNEDGTIIYSYVNPNYRFRAEPNEVIRVLNF